MNYYNDNDTFTCSWLENLIADGHLPPGDVDRRSITEVRPNDLAAYSQHHFFAGIGGWPYALDLAGWPRDRPVLTASVPCQPLSGAGLRQGHVDERHLWPPLFELIAELRPPICFGEQVASSDGYEWLAGVRTDLEAAGYACGSADLPASVVGGPHHRQRIWWCAVSLADADSGRLPPYLQPREPPADARRGTSARARPGPEHRSTASDMADPHSVDRRTGPRATGARAQAGDSSDVGHADRERPQRPSQPDDANGLEAWQTSALIWCLDPVRGGVWRRTEPGTFPVAHGVPNRVGRIRGYGNAIVPQVAAAFITAALEAAADL